MANAELKQAEHFQDDDNDDNDSNDVEDVSVHGLSHNTQNAWWRDISTYQAFNFLSLDVKRQASWVLSRGL